MTRSDLMSRPLPPSQVSSEAPAMLRPADGLMKRESEEALLSSESESTRRTGSVVAGTGGRVCFLHQLCRPFVHASPIQILHTDGAALACPGTLVISPAIETGGVGVPGIQTRRAPWLAPPS